MYQERPGFELPPDDATLWRYMDFTKFVSLLDRQALFFSRAIDLGDPFEGSLPKRNLEQIDEHVSNLDNIPADQKGLVLDLVKATYQEIGGRFILVNCWHENRSESDFMWKLYAQKKSGIAVMTSFGSLKRSFTCDAPVHIGRVQYMDYNRDFIPPDDSPPGNFFPIDSRLPFLHKRESFEPEREVRAIVPSGANPLAENAPGAYYEVDPSILIEKVFVAPYAEDWLMELVQSVVKRHGLNASVCRSALAAKPARG